jgi:hypothetical protein
MKFGFFQNQIEEHIREILSTINSENKSLI